MTQAPPGTTGPESPPSPAEATSPLQGRSLAGARTLAIAPTSFFNDYGCHVRIVEEVRALAAHGIRTTVATYPFGRTPQDILVHRARRLPGQRGVNPGSSLHKLSLDVALAARALQTAGDDHPHLIHGHLHEGAFIGWSVARSHHIPLVFDFQGSLTSEMQDHGFLSSTRSPAYWGFRAIERWVVDRADAIVTSTRHGADLLVREFNCDSRRITVVPDAVNTAIFRPFWEIVRENSHASEVEALRNNLGIPPGKPVVVYLGLLAEYQGITHLLRAAQALMQRGTEVHWLIMGFPGEERYRTLARWLGLADHVTLPGAIPYEQAPLYLSLGDVAVSPKISQTEGNGKLLNYIAMGLPTIAFDTAVSREILGDLGVYAPPGDWTALATEIESTLRDRRGAMERGRALRSKAIAEHDWSGSVKSLLAVYERILR